MKTELKVIESIEQLQTIENVSSKVSDKYVPIFTSEIVKSLAPEFTFINGVRFDNYHSRHSVNLKHPEGVVSIENSYDRSCAFRFRFYDGNISIPLDLERQVHKGENARDLTGDISIDKDEIVTAMQNAKYLMNNLKETKATEEFKIAIMDIVFEKVLERKAVIEIDCIIGDAYKDVYSYTNTCINRFIKGEYYIVIQNKDGKDVIRKGKAIKSRFRRLEITNDVYKYLQENFFEIFV